MDATEAIMVVLVVGMTVGIPLLGVTIRLSIRPLVDAWVKLREAQTGQASGDIEGLKMRVAALEAVLETRGMLPGGIDSLSLGSPLEQLPATVKREKS